MRESASSNFRLDRWLTLGLASPWRRHRAAPSGHRVRILMYHSISKRIDDHAHPYYRTVTTPERFREHMELLRDDGHRVMSLGDALQWMNTPVLNDGAEQPSPVVVTFDDGFADFFTQAFPVLDALQIPATVFLATGCLNGRFVNGQPCLRRAEVGELAARGVSFGSHTVSHPRLVHLGQGDIDKELGRSRQEIEQITGAPVKLFSYPYRFPEEDAAFTTRLAERLQRNGYEGGVTTSIGSASADDHPLFLKRLPVNDDDDAELFRAKLDGDYDWLHGVQLARKRWRQWTQSRAIA